MLLINTTQQLKPGKKIIRAEEYADYLDSKEIIAHARVKADKILAQANKKSKKIIDDANATFKKEKKRAIDEGKQAAHENIIATFLTISEKGIKHLAEVEQTIIRTITLALEKIIGEIPTGERIKQLVQRALKSIRDQKHIKVKVSENQLEQVKESFAKLSDEIKAKHLHFDFVVEPWLKEDQCIIESDVGTIDASLDTQIEAIANALKKTIM